MNTARTCQEDSSWGGGCDGPLVPYNFSSMTLGHLEDLLCCSTHATYYRQAGWTVTPLAPEPDGPFITVEVAV